MIIRNTITLKAVTAILLSILFTGCDKDNSNNTGKPDETDNKLVYAVIVGKSAYVGRLKDTEPATVSNQNAFEHGMNCYLYPYKNKLFVLETDISRITRYEKDGAGSLKKTGTLIFPAGAGIQGMAFAGDTKAYVSYKNQGKIVVINPQGMTIQKEIDLSAYAVGQNDNNPEPVQMKVNGDQLYVSLYQEKATFTPQESAAFVLIINTGNDNVVRMVKDSRGPCFIGNSDPDESMFTDEKGDMYFYCSSGYGYVPGAKDGFLRIKKGETAFDQSYLFTVNDKKIPGVPGNAARFIYRKIYKGNGKFICLLMIPALTSNPPDFVNDRNYQAFEVDVYNQSFRKLEIKPTAGYSCALTKYNDKILLGLATADGVGYYVYDTNNESVSTSPIVKTQGLPYYILPF